MIDSIQIEELFKFVQLDENDTRCGNECQHEDCQPDKYPD